MLRYTLFLPSLFTRRDAVRKLSADLRWGRFTKKPDVRPTGRRGRSNSFYIALDRSFAVFDELGQMWTAPAGHSPDVWRYLTTLHDLEKIS